jgi:type I site-specific restriction endonuclease
MALSEKTKQLIQRDVAEDMEKIESQYHEDYKRIAIQGITSYNERLEARLDKFQEEVSPFMVAELPNSPEVVRKALDINCSKIRETLTTINSLISPIGSPAIKILVVEALRDGISYLKELSVQTDIEIGRMVKRLEN